MEFFLTIKKEVTMKKQLLVLAIIALFAIPQNGQASEIPLVGGCAGTEYGCSDNSRDPVIPQPTRKKMTKKLIAAARKARYERQQRLIAERKAWYERQQRYDIINQPLETPFSYSNSHDLTGIPTSHPRKDGTNLIATDAVPSSFITRIPDNLRRRARK